MSRVFKFVITLLLLTACASPASANEGAWYYQWTHDAVKAEFGRFGGTAVYCAMVIAQREHGHLIDNAFQLTPGKWPAIQAAARELGRKPSWNDPRQNARVAMWLFEAAKPGPGGSFRRDWPATAPGWCP